MLFLHVICTIHYYNRANTVKIHGVKYACNAIVRIKAQESIESPFVYALIKDIFVYNDQKLFLVKLLCIRDYIQKLSHWIIF